MEKVDTKMGKSHMTIGGKKIGDYILRKVLGQGQFGKVWKAKHFKNGKEFAIKIIDKKKINRNPILKRLLQTEVSIMNEINHPNILHLFDFLESKNNYYLVVNFCNQGDMEYFMEKTNQKFFEESKAVYFLKQIMNGFQELRKKKVLHRDFKLANLFLHDDNLIIGDFGFAKSGNDMAETKLGTPLTMAYEIITATDSANYNSKADLWSVGVVYFQMLFGKTPFFGFTVPDLIRDIKRKVGNLSFPRDISDESKDLINRLLEPNPKKRINWNEFFNHKLFTKFKKDVVMEEIDDVFEHIGDLLIGDNNKKFEDEFSKNQLEKDNNENTFMGQDELLEYNKKKSIKAKEIEEINLNDSNRKNIEMMLGFQEISYRYHHEKNIILFLMYTVKKIQKLIKSKINKNLISHLFNISILILKKGILLNSKIKQNLIKKENTYFLNQEFFENFINDDKYNNIISIYEKDEKKMIGYFELVIERAKENKIEISYEKYLNLKNPNLIILDNYLNKFFSELRKLAKNEKFDNESFKKNFYLVLLSVKFCIESEKVFPYLPDSQNSSRKFIWKEFYSNHENLDFNNLIKHM